MMFEDLFENSEESEKQKQFNRFTIICADTILFALQVSNKEWMHKDLKTINTKVFEIVHGIISSVIGNRDMMCYEFDDEDYDLIFVATMRKALEIAEGPPVEE